MKKDEVKISTLGHKECTSPLALHPWSISDPRRFLEACETSPNTSRETVAPLMDSLLRYSERRAGAAPPAE